MAPSPVNITHVVIDGHGGIFAEMIELLADALGRLGHTVGVTTNQLVADRLNVLVGHTVFLSPGDFALIQRSGPRTSSSRPKLLTRTSDLVRSNQPTLTSWRGHTRSGITRQRIFRS
jgi:hypothetical protein